MSNDNKCAVEGCKGFPNGATLCPKHQKEATDRNQKAKVKKEIGKIIEKISTPVKRK